MAAHSKLMWGGIGWSILVYAVLVAFEPAARSPVILAAWVLLILGWPMALLSGRLAEPVAAQRAIVARGGQAIMHLSSEAIGQVEAIRDEIQRARNIFNEATDKLMSSFRDMSAQIQQYKVPAAMEAAELSVNQAVMSFQFQDMVTQLLDHVACRLDVLDEMLVDEQRLADVLTSATDTAGAMAALSEICQHVDHISQKMGVISQKVNNNPVIQSGFASGEVELF